MSTTSLILFVIAGLFLTWQVVLAILAHAMVRSGRFNQVKIGMLPLVLATIFCIIGIFTR
ncbi:hypothetical protein SEA_BILLNYE_179 [Streptomyces phage BillNye]|uniref:Uncharacterized protein n=2 Tax=Wilnyevirus billnye TaxID=2560486 RepID=A0A2L1IVZ8_9CAUD|nr:hypothetical protein FDJ30_gp082 [Streptomyces phage BillNye]AVD99351.1 hypothetical protein SEA_BILLNYE_179 [Streptomyces phage BillNye]QBZ72434.1 hypothetical protein SEA_CIRCINUS_180 [Streptomyces phage Circinus]